MSLVWAHFPGTGNLLNLALALADHAHDDGRRIFPSVSQLSQKTRQSERTVQYQLRRLEASGWLRLQNPGGGRGQAREYAIDPGWLSSPPPTEVELPGQRKGAKIAPFPDAKGCKNCTLSETERVQFDAEKGATAVAPQPSLDLLSTTKEPPLISPPSDPGCAVPSDRLVGEESSEDVEDERLARFMLDRLRQILPDHREPNWKRWRREIRLMRELEHRTRREIAELFAWANADPFWRVNIRSPGKLRQQWDALALRRAASSSAALPAVQAPAGPDRCCAWMDPGTGERCRRDGVFARSAHPYAARYCREHDEAIDRQRETIS